VNGRWIEQAQYEAMESPTGIEDALEIIGELHTACLHRVVHQHFGMETLQRHYLRCTLEHTGLGLMHNPAAHAAAVSCRNVRACHSGRASRACLAGTTKMRGQGVPIYLASEANSPRLGP
jgi:hypothetical protein